MTTKSLCIAAAALALTTAASHAAEQPYPSRPIRWIVPVPAGSTTDIVTRLVAQKINEAWGQQVVVDNRPGGVFTVGSEIVAKAPSDGYTIGTLLTPHVVNPFVLKNLPYDTQRDFTPVSLMVIVPGVLSMYPGVAANNLREVIAIAKAKPGQLNFGSPGQLTSGHLSMELLNLQAGIKITHVPYKGGAPAIIDLIGGHVEATVSGLQTISPQVKSGKLRMLAVMGEKRAAAFADVPTMKEQGLPKLVVETWYGLFAPAGTPPAVVAKINADANATLEHAEVRELLARQDMNPVGGTTERFAELVRSELARWARVVSAAKIRPD